MLAAGALLAGCAGGSDDRPDSGSSALGSQDVALTAREASCTDWEEASVEQRQTIIDGLEKTEGRPTTGAVGATLPDEEAYDLFERYCPNEFARAVKLYKLYVRAAAFQSAGAVDDPRE
jgi:hypothetical protein